MKTQKLKCVCLLAALVLTAMTANAANIDANAARNVASSFIKQQVQASHGTFNAPAIADLKLAYAEASSTSHGANAYYAFNIDGGGYVIIAGDDRASHVLGYSDQGHLDFTNLPTNLKALLSGYKEEIEYLQAHPELEMQPADRRLTSGTGVEPLIQSMWGQEMPYNLQCPVYNGEYCVVGCVATAMTQVMHYWQYPTRSPEIDSYYCYDIGKTLEALPETNFEYNKMLLSYCHWDWDNGTLVQDTYTDEQAQAVAKIARYCGQAVQMGYSPNGSGAYVSNQLSAMKDFGYNSNARDVSRSSWWSDNYTDAEWEAMIKEELDARRPILYSADDINGAGGHAFVCDGYDTNGMFHFNFGWYGTCNGWYVSTALNMTHRDGDQLKFNSGHEMLVDIVPPEYCLISTQLTAPSDLMVLGESLPVQATDFNIFMSYDYQNFVFSLHDATGKRVSASNAVKVTGEGFEQGSTVESAITLPTTLETGTYDLKLSRYTSVPRLSTLVMSGSDQLNVVGNVAKFGAPYQIDDVVLLISWVLDGSKPNVNIADVTALINAVLNN